jgi:hypothetical protein
LQIHENVEVDGRIHTTLAFGTLENLRRLFAADTWYMDGTFKTCPVLFQQLFTIHYIVGNRSFPALYCLLTGKAESIYRRLFQEIRDLSVRYNIPIATQNAMSDFEQAIRNAIRFIWPTWTVQGCLFHFVKCLRDKVTSLHLMVSAFCKVEHSNLYVISISI